MSTDHLRPILITEEQAAKLLGFSRATLRTWRCRGKGPDFVRIGSAIRYPLHAIEKFALGDKAGIHECANHVRPHRADFAADPPKDAQRGG